MYVKQLAEKLTDFIGTAPKYLSTICYNVFNWIAPVIDFAYNLQRDNGDINIKNSDLFQLGVPQAQICVNETTSEFHTEYDQSLTYICVPKQEIIGKKLVRVFVQNQYFHGIILAHVCGFKFIIFCYFFDSPPTLQQQK